MKFGIIAAGKGSRLTHEGIQTPKPLIRINGTPMIKRLIDLFSRNDAEQIVIIINTQSSDTARYLHTLRDHDHLPIQIIEKTTESSLHSFYEVARKIGDDKFCVTTVDTVFREEEFNDMIQSFMKGDEDGVMGVTTYVDDEKPLFVSTDESMHIEGFFDAPTPWTKYVSGGIYCLTSQSLRTLDKCIHNGVSHMRNFQRYLVKDGFRLKAYPFTQIMDVDHATDIEKAEKFMKRTDAHNDSPSTQPHRNQQE